MLKTNFRNLTLLIMFFMISGCAKIPAEAPELSSELGKRIAAIEESHIALLRRYMDEKRRRVDEFFEEEWTPNFAKAYFRQPNISRIWNQVVASGEEADRLKLLTLVGPKLQARVNAERIKLIQPLDEIEREIERRLRDEYRQARSINNSITSYLASASKVAENRTRLLELAGIEDAEISRVISDADQAVENLIDSREAANQKFDRFKSAIDKAKDTFVSN